MARRKDLRAHVPAPAAGDDPAARLERLMAAPVLQPWTPRWNPPIFRTPPKPSLLGDRWRSVFAGSRPPLPVHLHASYPRPTLRRPDTLSPDQARFTRPEWRPPVTEPPLRRPASDPPMRRPESEPLLRRPDQEAPGRRGGGEKAAGHTRRP